MALADRFRCKKITVRFHGILLGFILYEKTLFSNENTPVLPAVRQLNYLKKMIKMLSGYYQMGIWNRLGGVINSYFNDLAGETNSRLKTDNYAGANNDPDYTAAYEELNDYLNSKKTNPEQSGDDYYSSESTAFSGKKLPPEELRADFEYLGVPFGASAEACKTAYKKLLKLHHPDRHNGHEGNYKKATEKSAKINAAYDRIEKWRNN
jgi:hypothetical protein